jgi:hypothetical protein
MTMFLRGFQTRAVMFVLSGLAASAVVACASDQGGETEAVDIGETSAAVINAWTPYTSEEDPPIVCDGVSAFSQVRCSGDYCDNIRAYCRSSSRGTRGTSTWTTYFSEEGTDYRYCGASQWVTGLSCQEDYCDNISLQCTTISGVTPGNCYWTGWISEEGGGLLNFGTGYFARGAQCDGSNCDAKRWYVCQML